MSGGEAEATDGNDGEEVSVSRSDQKGAGLFLAYALTGVAFGLFLAITSLSLRTTTGGPFRRVAVSGLVLAGAITVAPWLKYPPNPPAVGDPDSVGERERLFVLLIVLAALLLAGLAHLSARLRRADWPDDRRVAAVVGAGLIAFAVLFAAMPASPDAVAVPANLVWQFRLNSLTGNLLVWTLLTVGLGVVWTEAARRPAEAAAPTAVRRGRGGSELDALQRRHPGVVGVLDLAHLGDGVGHGHQLVGGVAAGRHHAGAGRPVADGAGHRGGVDPAVLHDVGHLVEDQQVVVARRQLGLGHRPRLAAQLGGALEVASTPT